MIPPGTRRSKIRPPRRSAFSPQVVVQTPFDYDASWAMLASAFRHIQNKNVSSLSYENLYRIAYTLVLHKCGERLYEDVAQIITTHLHERRQVLLQQWESSRLSSAGFLGAVADEWSDHSQSMKLISDILMYMNRVYVKENHKLLIHDLGVVLFESDFLRHDHSEMVRLVVRLLCDEMALSRKACASERAVESLGSGRAVESLGSGRAVESLGSERAVESLGSERAVESSGSGRAVENLGSGRAVESLAAESHSDSKTSPSSAAPPDSRLYISKLLSMFELMADEKYASPQKPNIYNEEFEQPLVASCRVFYSDFARSALAARSGSLYLQQVSGLIASEELTMNMFSSNLFGVQTKPKIFGVMNETLIESNLDTVMDFPPEMHGLSYWLEPVLTSTLLAQNLRQPSGESSEPPDYSLELQTLYNLDGRIDPERKRLKSHLRSVIVSQGLQLPVEIRRALEKSSSSTDPGVQKKSSLAGSHATAFALEWIEAILSYQRNLGVLVQNAFQSDPSVEFTVFASLKQFINTGFSSSGSGSSHSWPKRKPEPVLNPAELLSVYMDYHIKQVSKQSEWKGTGPNPNLDFLNKSICFLKLVEDKHAFENHYAAHFAKRFLNAKSGASESDDLEDVMISKLWDEVFTGSHYLERIVKMRKDVKSSAELSSEWRRFVSESDNSLVNLDLKICNLAEWPKSMTKDHQAFGAVDGQVGFIWPKQLRPTMKVFEEFWRSGKRNENKALYWYPKFGSMDLCITYPSRTYEINMSTYAGIIMLLFAPQSSEDNVQVSAFDQKIVLTYTEIYELTRIPEADLKRQLRSIAVAPRSRLLVKSPMSKDIRSSDTFQLNSKFKSTSSRIKVLTVKSEGSEKTEESSEVQSNILEGKQHLVDASIVRVMKSRQTIKHNDLIEETIKQLQTRFLPSMIHIKQRIEDLIEKEYLRRDPDASNVYHYLA